MRDNRGGGLKLGFDPMLWGFPVLVLVAAVILRLVAGEPITAALLVGAPLSGLVFALYGKLWGRRKRQQLKRELSLRAAELEASRHHLETVIDSSPEAIVLTGLRGRIRLASLSAGTLTGRSRESLLGTPVARLFADHLPEALRIRNLLKDSEEGLSGYSTILLTEDGREVPVSLSATVLRGPDGQAREILAILTDLTDKRKAEKQALASERLRVLGESVAGIAHELNNPLTGVIGYLQLAARGDLAPETQEILLKAGREADRMARTIRTHLGFVRQHAPMRAPTDLAELVREVREFHGYQLIVNNISLDIVAEETPPALVDPHQIQQVLLNLVKNSDDALRDGGKGGRIEIRVFREQKDFIIEVSDDGPGVPETIREKVFDHFFTTKPSGKGTGLGLSICRQIVEAHGGRIRILDAPGGGALFRIELPVPSAEVPSATPRLEPDTHRILIVDDETSVRDYLADVLEADGHHVLQASCGIEAVEILCEGPVDVAFVDMRMPDMDGELCSREMIQVRPELEGHIVFMSGDTYSRDDPERFLEKPMDPEEILARLDKVVVPAETV